MASVKTLGQIGASAWLQPVKRATSFIMAGPTRFIFYDLETTGSDTAFDVPVQVGMVGTDDALEIIGSHEWRARPPRHVIPHPMALVVTHRTIDEVMVAPLSCYELASRLSRDLERRRDTLFVGYNSIRFDEEMLRQLLWQTLHEPYATVSRGNGRIDVLRLMLAASALAPGAIAVPTSAAGKTSFRLEDIAPANGFAGHNAHDALGDVMATIHLARLARDRVPAIWHNAVTLWPWKRKVQDLLGQRRPTLIVESEFTRMKPRLVLPLGPDPSRDSRWFAVDLTVDPGPLLSSPVEELASLVPAHHSPFSQIRTNAMPLVFRSDETELPPTLAAERAAAETRAQAIRADPGFAARVAEAFLMAEPERPTPEYPEQRIYDGFASRQDRERATAFHDAPPRGKVEIVRAIADERFREFGFRIIHERWPDTLMAAERADRERRLAERLSAPPGVPWTSVPAARAAIAELLPDADEARRSILQGYARWLDARFGPARQGPAGPTDGDALA